MKISKGVFEGNRSGDGISSNRSWSTLLASGSSAYTSENDAANEVNALPANGMARNAGRYVFVREDSDS